MTESAQIRTEQPFPLARPMALRSLLDEAVRESRKHFGTVFRPLLVPLLGVLTLLGVAQVFYTRSVIGISSGGNASVDDPFDVLGAMGIYFGALMGIGCLLWFLYAGMAAAATDAIGGRPSSVVSSLGFLLKPRRLVVFVMLLLGTLLGWMCCMVPGIAVFMLYSMSIPVMVQEGLTGTAALKRAQELSNYKGAGGTAACWHLLLLLVAAVLLSMGASFATQVPLQVLQQGMTFRDIASSSPEALDVSMMGNYTWLIIPTQIVGGLIQALISYYMGIAIAMVYFDTRRRSDGLDLDLALGSLLASRPAPAASMPEPPPAAPSSPIDHGAPA